jgi:hypothetical protein
MVCLIRVFVGFPVTCLKPCVLNRIYTECFRNGLVVDGHDFRNGDQAEKVLIVAVGPMASGRVECGRFPQTGRLAFTSVIKYKS